MKPAPSPLTFGRPLGLGEIFDRAFSLLVSSWLPILTLAVIGYSPWIVLHYVVSAQWLSITTGEGPSLSDPSFFSAALVTMNVLNSIDMGTWTWIVGIGGRFVLLTTACAIAIVVARRSRGAISSASDALQSVNERWESVAPVAAIASLGIAGVSAATASVSHQFVAFLGLDITTVAIAARFSVVILAALLEQTALLVAVVWAVAATVGQSDLAMSARSAADALFGRGRATRTFGVCIALLTLTVPVALLEVLGAAALRLTRNPVPGTLIDAIANVSINAFEVLVAWLYYVDARFRAGDEVTALLEEPDVREEPF